MQVCVALVFSIAFPFLICSDLSMCCRLHINGALHAYFLTLYFILLCCCFVFVQCFHTYTTHVLEQLSVTRCLKTSQQGLDGEHFAIPFLRCLTSLNVSYLLLMSFCLSPICVRTHREKPTHKFAISPFYFCHISHSHSHPLPLLLSSAGSDRARRPLISWMGTEMPSTIPVTILYGQVGAGWVRRCNFLSPLCVCVCACACVHAWVCICLHVLGLMGKDRSAGG
mmetsp:Transcript_43738/g.114040  ORF Transcript_43738/g.114040 Transcript_43738/m.114040 type:complete len:225 (-) Transcript_43738:558-1232(-)